ncbi:TPA: hypothetical protein U5E00_002360 [Yersinia enterocolitica]|uniref:hypothetical protein n=1 Tax=Yersinia enterocolitica TaxID=630 RepID=UPI0005DE45E9|nr:hypothetical protein [Yersinia enterocolitica]EKN3386827.1 hypothetical protein [Yersinia enterocolitica]EKN3766482.1 hypothetical protein [Yersinia enterocolitica]EKN4083117.1 hypothetical protein [Yersinia enterocolitica]ELI8281465.1 hypothetical protein [Yersinia enterocolitica]ELW7387558.1 hypothetical protein [Yersinia enterocolitica]
MSILKTLKELITNPSSGRLSTSDTTLVGAFIVSSLAVAWATVTGQSSDVVLGLYLGAWVTQSQVSKHQALKRDKELTSGSNAETP